MASYFKKRFEINKRNKMRLISRRNEGLLPIRPIILEQEGMVQEFADESLQSIRKELTLQGAAFYSDLTFRKFRVGSEWKEIFPDFHFWILNLPREVVLKFRKIRITGKFCSISHMEYPKLISNQNLRWVKYKVGIITRRICSYSRWLKIV